MILSCNNISKTLGNKKVLDQISLCLESGHIYGFIGRNGSGKTMLFRAISGLMHIDSGEIMLDGKILHRDMDILPDLGLVIENAGLYPEFSGFDNLKLLARVNHKIGDAEIKKAIQRVGLDSEDRTLVAKYSLGMKQRIVIAQAIMESPRILILDEPTHTIDEEGVELIRRLILEEKANGALVLISSHDKEDITLLADEIYSMSEGRIVKSEKNYGEY